MSEDSAHRDSSSGREPEQPRSVPARSLISVVYGMLLAPAALAAMGLDLLFGPMPDILKEILALGIWPALAFGCFGFFRSIERRVAAAPPSRATSTRTIAAMQRGRKRLESSILGWLVMALPIVVWIHFLLGWIFERHDEPIFGLFEEPLWALFAVGLVLPWPTSIWLALLSLIAGQVKAAGPPSLN